MKQTLFPAIDWEGLVAMLNGEIELARNLIGQFVAELPEIQTAINQSLQQQDTQGAAEHIHKLLGACCYCGVPNLKATLSRFEKMLRNHPQISYSELQEEFNREVEAILHMYQAHQGYRN